MSFGCILHGFGANSDLRLQISTLQSAGGAGVLPGLHTKITSLGTLRQAANIEHFPRTGMRGQIGLWHRPLLAAGSVNGVQQGLIVFTSEIIL